MIKVMRFFTVVCFTFFVLCIHSFAQDTYHEMYRPQVHFSPKEKWINDPNGMVYYKGVYHLFFQYYPDSTVWGPMHWGHATSKDLVHWHQEPIALYPDSLGYIFSGSAVVDKNNTSGFSKNGQTPLIAIFTQHDPVRQKQHTKDYENESIAVSLDDGKTWKKYEHNPVLKNPGITDFRDPKVMWYEPAKKWIMTLATKDRVTFYSSSDLKEWKRESEFGSDAGAHGGVWECPDLFPLNDNGKQVWVLIVNINPGGPNMGSATQYFLGDFNGNAFTSVQTATKWLDYGPDEYAGITWSNTGNRKIFLGWMSNWLYANRTPTVKWRNAMTIPRELKVAHIGNDTLVSSVPVEEMKLLYSTPIIKNNLMVSDNIDIAGKASVKNFPCRVNLSANAIKDFVITLSNDKGDEVKIGYNKGENKYYIDRRNSGNTSFEKDFAARHTVPRFCTDKAMDMSLIIDESSVEMFADNGLSVMTEVFFPNQPFNHINLQSADGMTFRTIEYISLKSIWK